MSCDVKLDVKKTYICLQLTAVK